MRAGLKKGLGFAVTDYGFVEIGIEVFDGIFAAFWTRRAGLPAGYRDRHFDRRRAVFVVVLVFRNFRRQEGFCNRRLRYCDKILKRTTLGLPWDKTRFPTASA